MMIANPDEWPSWGRTGSEAHYSPLDEIDTGNVADTYAGFGSQAQMLNGGMAFG